MSIVHTAERGSIIAPSVVKNLTATVAKVRLSDIHCISTMKMVSAQFGISTGIFDLETWSDASSQKRIYKLISEDRVQYVSSADYRDDSQLYIVIN